MQTGTTDPSPVSPAETSAEGLQWYIYLLIAIGAIICLGLLVGVIFYLMNKDTGAVPSDSFRAECE